MSLSAESSGGRPLKSLPTEPEQPACWVEARVPSGPGRRLSEARVQGTWPASTAPGGPGLGARLTGETVTAGPGECRSPRGAGVAVARPPAQPRRHARLPPVWGVGTPASPGCCEGRAASPAWWCGAGAGGRARESHSRQGLGLCSWESIKLSLVVTESRGFSLHALSPGCDPEQWVSHQRYDPLS